MRVVVLTVAALVTTWLPEIHSQQHALFVKRDALRSVKRVTRQTSADQMVQNILQWLQGVYTQNSRRIRQGSFREYLPPTQTNTQKPRPFQPPNKDDDDENFIGYPPAGISPDPPFHFPGDNGFNPGGNGGFKPGYPGYLPPKPFPTKLPTGPGSSTTPFPGYPSGGPSTSHPGTSTGYPGGSTGYPEGSTGYPGGSTGYPGGSTGYPGGSTGYPGGSTGYPGGSTGYPGGSTGYPGTDYPEHSTPGYPGETTAHPPVTEISTHPPTHPPTAPPTHPSTHPPTHPPTAPPTHPPTEIPTHPPTHPPTEPPTHPPTAPPPTHPPTAPPPTHPTPTHPPPTHPPSTHPPTHPPQTHPPQHETTEHPIHPPAELIQTDRPTEENNVAPSDNESTDTETSEDLKHPPHIHAIDVECAKDMMTINIEFNRPFNGIIYSKGYFNHPDCRYVQENTDQTKYTFTVSLNSCGTEFINAFDTQGQSYLENVLVLQNEAGIQEVWDTIRAVRCLWEGNLNKALSVALSVGMLTQEIVTFSGDTAMAKLDIQLGKGPFAQPANGLVKIGDTMTLVVSVTGDPGFDIQVKDCRAKDSTGENVVALTDDDGCVIKPKLFGAFQKTRNTGNTGASIMAYAFFNAFKFPDVMDLMIECNVELCKTDCEMCTSENQKVDPGRRRRRDVSHDNDTSLGDPVTMGKLLRVILPEDLTNGEEIVNLRQRRQEVCMSTEGFVVSAALLISLLTCSTLVSAHLWLKNQRLVLQKF